MANPLQKFPKYGGEGGIRTPDTTVTRALPSLCELGKSKPNRHFRHLEATGGDSHYSHISHTSRYITGTFSWVDKSASIQGTAAVTPWPATCWGLTAPSTQLLVHASVHPRHQGIPR